MKRRILQISLLFAAVAMIVTGIIMGQPGEVLAKAAKICLECIGIG